MGGGADERVAQRPQEACLVHGASGEGDRLLGGVLGRGHHRKAAHPRRLETLPLGGTTIPPTMTPIDGSSNTEYRKFMPDDPVVVHWFDIQSFTRLIRGYVREGDDLPLGQFIKKFRGFSSRKKAAAAREKVPDVRKLSDLSDGDVAGLFVAMRRAVKEPSHKVLGDPLGKEHMVGALRRIYGVSEDKRSWYSKPIKTTLNGAPAVVEAAVLEVENELEVTSLERSRLLPPPLSKTLFVGLNHSPIYEDPLNEIHITHPNGKPVSGFGIR